MPSPSPPPPPPPPSVHTTKRCSRCGNTCAITAFPFKPDGQRGQACSPCALKKAEQQRKLRAAKKRTRDTSNKENETAVPTSTAPSTSNPGVDSGACTGSASAPPVVACDPARPLRWRQFGALVEEYRGKECEMKLYVYLDELLADGDADTDPADPTIDALTRAHDIASAVARVFRERMGYRFNSRDHVPYESSEYFRYYCAQREGQQTRSQRGQPKAKSSRVPEKQRATFNMERFTCNGSLGINVPREDPRIVRVHMRHDFAHKQYCDNTMPEDVKKLIASMPNATPSAVWAAVVREDPHTELEQHQVAWHWANMSQAHWRRSDDQIASARALVEAHEAVTTISLPEEDGISSIAFSLDSCVNSLNSGVVEVGLDSTWKTNALGWETYAIVAEANGQSIPLAVILTTSTAEAAKGAKDRLIQGAINSLSSRCPNIRFTLTDKDMSEINACRTSLPQSKHQLCYWHVIRYLEQRLGEATPPAYYDARIAHKTFRFIDPTWVPGVNNGDAEEGFVSADTAVPFEPVLEELEFNEDETCLPPLFVLRSGDARIPIWPTPEKAAAADLPQFCPAEHRRPIVEMFRKHLHLHPSIPADADGTYLTAEQIHTSAVYQIYRFCYERNISQAWAYLWNRWYAPTQWPLWARAPCPAIPVLKTTMIVESFWRHLKHRDLAIFNRPRLDLMVFTVLNSTLPTIQHRLATILEQRRGGRPSGLAPWQADMKAEWLELSKPDALRNMQKELAVLRKKGKGIKFAEARADRLAELEADRARPAGNYCTSVQRWTCSCPAYLVSRFLLCKHLVRAANPLLGDTPSTDLWFWFRLRRRRLVPYYIIPGIHTLPIPDCDSFLDAWYHPVPASIPAVTSLAPSPSHSHLQSSPSPLNVPEELPIPAEDAAALHERPAALEDAVSDKVYFSPAELELVRSDTATLMDILEDANGIHPNLLKVLQPVLGGLREFARDYHTSKRRKTSERTYKDTTPLNMFLS